MLAVLLIRLVSSVPGEAIDLRWDGPPECPAAAFDAALARYLDPATPASEPLPVRARVRRTRAQWRLELDVGAGTRQLTAESCETVVDAAAFVVAQAVGRASPAPDAPPAEAEAIEVPPPPPPQESPPPETKPAPDPTPQALAPPPATEAQDIASPLTPIGAPRSPLRGAVRVRGGPSGGALPGVTADVGLLVGLTARRWRVDFTGLARLPVTKQAAGTSVGAQLQMWAVGARGCGLPRTGPLTFPLCAGLEVGQVRGRSLGLQPPGHAASAWAAATASPGLAWEARPWLALTLEFELAVALVRHDWVIRGLPPIHRLGPVQLRGFVGVELRFGGPTNP